MICYKSVYDAIEKKDGLRILATRYRGRGMKKSRYHVWMPNLGPSTALLSNVQSGKLGWGDFKNAYRKELLSSEDIDAKNKINSNKGQKFTLRLIKQLSKKQNLTLMCHCETGALHCHLRILEKVLNQL